MKVTLFALLLGTMASTQASPSQLTSLHDETRQRTIPISVSLPQQPSHCSVEQPCKVAFISAGYGVSHKAYSFINNQLTSHGYLSVAIKHELASDPPLSVSGNLYQTRQENWQRGAKTLRFVREYLTTQFPEYDFTRILLVGHSNGGDLSSLLINQGAEFIAGLITLDHRRVPLPRTTHISVLSIRASDFPADPGVLYTTLEQSTYGGCIVKIPGAKHNDMTDQGPAWLKASIAKLLSGYLNNKKCEQLMQ